MTVRVPVVRVHPDATLPAGAYAGDAGLDLATVEGCVLAPGERRILRTGLAVAIPDGFAGFVQPRSGLAARHGITVVNAPGTIDADYRGEVMVALINHGDAAFTVTRGMRVAQLLVARVLRVEWQETSELTTTDRGAGGFGHTGH